MQCVFGNGMVGCEYGDRADWCRDHVQRDRESCRRQDIAHQCCETCRPYDSTTRLYHICSLLYYNNNNNKPIIVNSETQLFTYDDRNKLLD